MADGHHEVIYQSVKAANWRSVLGQPADLYVAAGGDGTVRKVMTELAETEALVGVLPLGTANNIARRLGLPTGDPERTIASWDGAIDPPQARTFDVPRLETSSGESRFVESVGGGLFAELLVTADAEETQTATRGRLEDGRRLLRSLLRAEPLAPSWSLHLDGEDRSGEYVAVEAMNFFTFRSVAMGGAYFAAGCSPSRKENIAR